MIARRLLYTGSGAMMTSALLPTSAVIVAPFAENAGAAAGAAAASGPVGATGAAVLTWLVPDAIDPASVAWASERGRCEPAAAVAAGQHRAQRLRDLRGLRVFQVDDEHVAAGAAGRVELLDQLPDPRDPPRIVGADQDAVRPGVGHHGHALLDVGRHAGSRGARAYRRAAG